MPADIVQHLKSAGIKCYVWIHLDTFIITDLSYSLFGNPESRLGIGKRMKWSFLYILIMRLLYGHNITSYQVNTGNWLKERADFVEYLTYFFILYFFFYYMDGHEAFKGVLSIIVLRGKKIPSFHCYTFILMFTLLPHS